MTLHLHPEYVPGCYRCELSADEWMDDEPDCPLGDDCDDTLCDHDKKI